MGDFFSKCTKQKVDENKPASKDDKKQKGNEEVKVEENVAVETDMKRNALNINSNRIEVTIKHPDSKSEDLQIVLVRQVDEYWIIIHGEIYRKTADSEEWRYVELYSTGRYFERQITLKERLKFTKILETIVMTLASNGQKYVKILREITSNTDDIKLTDFETYFDADKIV